MNQLMMMVINNNQRRLRFGLASLILLLLAGVLSVMAQTEEEWEVVSNLSHSGASTEPTLVIDANGVLHAFWQDRFAGFVYSSGDGTNWSPPASLRLPFSQPSFTQPGTETFEMLHKPLLLVGSNNVMHAFWRNKEGILLYSRALLSELTSVEGWTSPTQIAASAVAFSATISLDDRLHVAYMRSASTAEAPAGVYYRRSDNTGAGWSESRLLYQSNYMRSISPDQGRIRVATNGRQVYVVWDNRLLDAVYFVRSDDVGSTWLAPIVIDQRQPEDEPESRGPSNIDILTDGNNVHLTWVASHEEGRCTQYHQWSDSLGQEWWPRIDVLESSRDCPRDSQFVKSKDSVVFLMTIFGEEVYLQVWDGAQWSEDELQDTLSSFTAPETYRRVALDCLQSAVSNDNYLLVVGCGQSNDQDIWMLRRPLGLLSDWTSRFMPPPLWSSPVSIASSPAYLLPPLSLIADTEGRFHAFWSQSSETITTGGGVNTTGPVGNAIFYSRLHAEQWLPPRQILASPDGKSDQIAVARGSEGTLYVVWSGGKSGQIYFSRTLIERAVSIGEWLTPLSISTHGTGGASRPDILVGPDETIHIAYAVPVNEQRGIYLTYSADGGETWAQPVRAFDGVAAGWEMVDQPRLAMTSNGDFHLLWTRHTLPGGTGPLGLVYARSEDGGQTWSAPEVVREGPVIWSGMIGIDERQLHRVWIEANRDRSTLWHQFSIDGGLSWSAAFRVADPATTSGPATLIVDPAGEPRLLQLAVGHAGELLLQEWLWAGDRWQIAETVQLDEAALDGSSLAADAAPDGHIGVLYISQIQDPVDGRLRSNLAYTQRTWEAPALLPTPLPTLTPTPQPLPTNTPLSEPSPTPTIAFSTAYDETNLHIGPFNTGDLMGGIAIGLIPALLIVMAVAIVAGLRMTRNK